MPTPPVQLGRFSRLLLAPLLACLLLSACGSDAEEAAAVESAIDNAGDSSDETSSDDHDEADHTHDDGDDGHSYTTVDLDLFFDGAIVGDVDEATCTLSAGTETSCYTFTVSGDPVTYDTGPFCPTDITDTAEAGGIWFDGNDVYDLDGEFITNLAELYGDENWLMYNEDGSINVTETAEEFDLAARPNVDPSLQNHCVEGLLEWLPNGEPVTSTIQIPVEPVFTGTPATTSGNLGVTLDGIVIAQAAPVDAILSAYTIAAFDDCGGHYNPIDGYHLHGVVGCSEVEGAVDGETPMFAYAMDGVPIHSPLEEGSGVELDECNGHDTGDGYHYHANSAEQNLVLPCFMGELLDAGDAGRPARPGADE